MDPAAVTNRCRMGIMWIIWSMDTCTIRMVVIATTMGRFLRLDRHHERGLNASSDRHPPGYPGERGQLGKDFIVAALR
jgi:H2-forming N5,N10-methylenetetrahydromethanopterin dehydrogenase-like enzyme